MSKNNNKLTNAEAKELVKSLYIKRCLNNPMAVSDYSDEVYFELLTKIKQSIDCLDLETCANIMEKIGAFSNKRRELIVKYMQQNNVNTILSTVLEKNPRLLHDEDKNV